MRVERKVKRQIQRAKIARNEREFQLQLKAFEEGVKFGMTMKGQKNATPSVPLLLTDDRPDYTLDAVGVVEADPRYDYADGDSIPA